ncbi:unnamed protein product [Adineta ricciae]|uniref:Uncharacterized protein n=1 Tax=Adineta ricciae TaxID=249248 RepID=A0A815N334_ADIRI|nr:unnamed protein product [Adineta ricciae]CAF1433437.1 unnamed protein product [Adineta ricciae]
MSLHVSKLEHLSNELQIILLKYLNFYDRYLSFFGINRRFDLLVKHLTPTKIDNVHIKQDIELLCPRDGYILHGTYMFLPHLDCNLRRLKWQFFPSDRTPQCIHQRIRRVCVHHLVDLHSFFSARLDMKELRNKISNFIDEDPPDYYDWDTPLYYTRQELESLLEVAKKKVKHEDEEIMRVAQKIWTELLERNLIKHCFDF